MNSGTKRNRRGLRFWIGAAIVGCGLAPCVWAGTLTFEGITEPFMDVTLSASVAGIVWKEHFQEGDAVKKGDVIVELDKTLEELDAARRKLVMDRDKVDMEGTRQLFKNSKAVSRDEVLKTETEFMVAEAEYRMAMEQLEKRKVISPLEGAIVEIFLEPGEACQPYDPLVRVVDARQCYFVGHIEARAAGALKTGQSARLEVESAGGPVTLEGKITYIAPVVDPASGLARVKALFENPNGKIRPGVAGKLIVE